MYSGFKKNHLQISSYPPPAQKMSRDTIFLNKFLDNKIPKAFFSKISVTPPARVT